MLSLGKAHPSSRRPTRKLTSLAATVAAMTPIRDAYLTAAQAAVNLINNDAVASAWDKPSALEGFTVGGLASHLGGQLFSVQFALTREQPETEAIPITGHYERAAWVGADLDAEVNVKIRKNGEDRAHEGPEQLRSDMAQALATVTELLPQQPVERTAPVPAGPWALTLDDFLITRMMEIAVHSDDLACSVRLETPDLPSNVLDPVLSLLTKLSVARHGQAAVLRALTRAERAPSTITAF